MCWTHVINIPAQLYMVPSWGGGLGNKKRVGENDSKLDSDEEREEQPGEVVISSGWFCTEDKAKVLRH